MKAPKGPSYPSFDLRDDSAKKFMDAVGPLKMDEILILEEVKVRVSAIRSDKYGKSITLEVQSFKGDEDSSSGEDDSSDETDDKPTKKNDDNQDGVFTPQALGKGGDELPSAIAQTLRKRGVAGKGKVSPPGNTVV